MASVIEPHVHGVIDGDGTTITGEQVLNEMFDLIRHRLPYVDVNDPVRPYLARLAPLMCRGLGHPMLTPAEGGGVMAEEPEGLVIPLWDPAVVGAHKP